MNKYILLGKQFCGFRKHTFNIIINVENISLRDVCLGKQISNIYSHHPCLMSVVPMVLMSKKASKGKIGISNRNKKGILYLEMI